MQDTQFLTFSLGSESFGVEILRVKEIIEFRDLTKVPKTPTFIPGVINLRGSVVPVVDLGQLFSGKRSEINKRTCIIIVETEREDRIVEAGILVDEVKEVLDIQQNDIEPAPTFGAKLNTEFIRGMGKIDDKVVIILDVGFIMSYEDLTGLSEVNLGDLKENAREHFEKAQATVSKTSEDSTEKKTISDNQETSENSESVNTGDESK